MLLYDFLKHLQQSKTEELNKIQHELQMVNENCKQVEENLANLKVGICKDHIQLFKNFNNNFFWKLFRQNQAICN